MRISIITLSVIIENTLLFLHLLWIVLNSFNYAIL